VLARTDPDAPAHRGISYIIVDLQSDGVEPRPLRLSTGDAEFGEVFFDEVVVPKENLLGPLNGGWGIAMHTLSHERGPYAMARQGLLRAYLDRLVGEAVDLRRDGTSAISDPALRATLARAHVAVEVLKQQCYMSAGKSMANGHPGFEASVDKILLGEVEQEVAAAALDVLGPLAATDAEAAQRWQHVYLYGRAGSVYGGTAEIQKNIIAERILGLPRSM
jgi:alkylation response protein AidB-like acyl-CoA dehydrogenase